MTEDFQGRVVPWLLECFGQLIASDRVERNQRFIEEALELIQANGATRDEAHALVDYVFSRPVGELKQEVGGVMVTLAALCHASDVSMAECGETELTRIWGKVAAIREKQAAKTRYPAKADPLTGLATNPVLIEPPCNAFLSTMSGKARNAAGNGAHLVLTLWEVWQLRKLLWAYTKTRPLVNLRAGLLKAADAIDKFLPADPTKAVRFLELAAQAQTQYNGLKEIQGALRDAANTLPTEGE